MNEFGHNLFSNDMAIQLNVFTPFMKGRIVGKIHGGFAVTVNNSSLRKFNEEITEEELQPL